MSEMPDKCFDIAICDPPYGIGDFNQSTSRKVHKKIDWNNEIPPPEYFEQLIRVSKNRIVWGINYFTEYIRDKGRLIHDKTDGLRKKTFDELSDIDLASHSFGVNMKMFRFVWQGNAQGSTINWKNEGLNARIHPCQKPVELYEWCLMLHGKPGDKILDTHSGSGSLAIACHNLGFDLQAYEADKQYYLDSVKRLEYHRTQLRMFN